jgi:hypothetical protein
MVLFIEYGITIVNGRVAVLLIEHFILALVLLQNAQVIQVKFIIVWTIVRMTKMVTDIGVVLQVLLLVFLQLVVLVVL